VTLTEVNTFSPYFLFLVEPQSVPIENLKIMNFIFFLMLDSLEKSPTT